MSETFGISVAISTMDRPDALRGCLDSLAASTRVPREVIVVDQSMDDTSEAVAGRARRVGLPIVYVRDSGTGLARSQNIAIETASSDFVAVIDDDCVAGVDWLEQIRRIISDAPEIDLLAGRVLPLGPPTPGLVPVSTRTSTKSRSFRRLHAPWHVGSGNNFTVRKEAFLRIGGCDTRLGPGSPARGGLDMDLFYRLIRSGATARYDPSIVVFHEQKPSEERMARRPMYGHGMGACFSFWARQHDPLAPVMLLWWIAWRSARCVRATLEKDGTRAREEIAMLTSTFRGLVHGVRA